MSVPRRVDTTELIALQTQRERIRNICIIAHVDHGKTTLTDSLVSSNGLISSKLAGRLRYLDFMEEEQQRGITMKSTAIALLHSREERMYEQKAEASESSGDPAHSHSISPSAVSRPKSTNYLINLIDSPGHLDFSPEVSSATRMSDGAVIIVDALEGVSSQTVAVMRQAWSEHMKPCVVLNKIDRLALELQLSPSEAYFHLQRVLERVNAVSSSLITHDQFAWGQEESIAAALEELRTFARMWAKRLGLKPRMLLGQLWGDYAFNVKTNQIEQYRPEGPLKPIFAQLVLEPIWRVYHASMQEPDADKLATIVQRLNLDVSARDLSSKDSRERATHVFRRWLPLSKAVLDMVADILPSPLTAQQQRLSALWRMPPAEDVPQSASQTQTQKDIGLEDGVGLDDVYEAVRECDGSAEAPVVVFVSKLIWMHPKDLCGCQAVNPDSDDAVLIGLGRVFSGVLYPKTRLYVLGPKYDPRVASASQHAQLLPENTQLALFLMMGIAGYAVPHVSAGNLVGISGLGDSVVKSATLCSAKPIVRVAVDVVRQGDLRALEKGLAKLYQADPAVEVSVQENGEHLVAALGELHLEQCIKVLREKFACVALRISSPMVSFRETVTPVPAGEQPPVPSGPFKVPPWCEEEGIKRARRSRCALSTPMGDCQLSVACRSIPDKLTALLDSSSLAARALQSDQRVDDTSTLIKQEALHSQIANLLGQDEAAGAHILGIEIDPGSIVAFGPRHVGPNLLCRSSSLRIRARIKSDVSPASHESDVDLAESWKAMAWHNIMNSINVGFQLATGKGPLMEEPMRGVAFVVEEATFLVGKEDLASAGDSMDTWLASRLATLGGQIMSTAKAAFRGAFMASPVRILEAIFVCELQCHRDQLGRLYAVLARRRGRVIEEDIIEGTDLFTIRANLPVAESFGFANELFEKTSGAATSPQLAFSHWEKIDLDPFWHPQDEDDREEFGEEVREMNVARKYIGETRKRKGLGSGEPVVVHAERQRTLSRKK